MTVFKDLGLDKPEELSAKGLLAIEIVHIIKKRNLTQTQAAEILNTDQSHISRLRNGRIDHFTFDRLLGWLNKLDRDIELVIKRKPKQQESGQVSVFV